MIDFCVVFKARKNRAICFQHLAIKYKNKKKGKNRSKKNVKSNEAFF